MRSRAGRGCRSLLSCPYSSLPNTTATSAGCWRARRARLARGLQPQKGPKPPSKPGRRHQWRLTARGLEPQGDWNPGGLGPIGIGTQGIGLGTRGIRTHGIGHGARTGDAARPFCELRDDTSPGPTAIRGVLAAFPSKSLAATCRLVAAPGADGPRARDPAFTPSSPSCKVPAELRAYLHILRSPSAAEGSPFAAWPWPLPPGVVQKETAFPVFSISGILAAVLAHQRSRHPGRHFM